MKRLYFGGNIVTVGTDLPFAVLTENDRIAALLSKNEAFHAMPMKKSTCRA